MYLGLSGWGPGVTLIGSANTDPKGSATMAVGVVARPSAVPATQQVLAAYGNGTAAGNFGWILYHTAAASMRFAIFDGGGTFRETAGYTVVAGDVGKEITFLGTYSGGALRLMKNDAQVGADVTGLTGYSTPNVALGPAIGGTFNGGNNATSWTIFGVAVSLGTAPTLAEGITWQTYVRGRRRITRLPQPGTTHLWNLRPGAQATQQDRIAGVSLSRSGTLVDELGGWVW